MYWDLKKKKHKKAWGLQKIILFAEIFTNV